MNDTWISPFTFKLVNNFLEESYLKFLYDIIQNKKFYESTQGINGKNVIQKEHKIRLDYTLTNAECAFIDKPLITKADCNCNLRERWRLLYYKGEDKSFRSRHTDWTTHACHRRMSIIIGLSDIHDYDGGELVLNDLNIKLKIPNRAAFIFDSKLIHEVLPVTSGNRYILQAFLFDDSGYALKTVKNNITYFQLLGCDIDSKPMNSDNQHTENKNINYTRAINNKIIESTLNTRYQLIENKNAHHSRIKNIDYNYIGTFNQLNDLEKYIENNNIYCFTWHKPNHLKSKWAGRAYKWSMEEAITNNRFYIALWISESNVISGILKESPILHNTNLTNCDNSEKTITVLSTNGGPGNQIIGIKECLIMSNILERKLLFPPIIQHYVLNRKYRNSTESGALKYWNFDDIFNYKDTNIVNLKDYLSCLEYNIIYCLNKVDLTQKLRIEHVLELDNKNYIYLNKKKFNNNSDYDELIHKNDTNLILKNLYNNTSISKCFWNGCDTCKLNDNFYVLYKNICSKFDFSSRIKSYGDIYIKNNFKNADFICLHLRYPDCGNVNIKDINKLYDETDINTLISKYKNEHSIKHVFVATNNKQLLLTSSLNHCNLLEENELYDECESFIEQYIATQSKIFIYTGGIHAKPNHTHLRSTWSSFVVDYRNYLLNKDPTTNVYLTDCVFM